MNARQLVADVSELERLAHDQPEMDQMLAAIREQAEALTEMCELPWWRTIAWWRAYRRCRSAQRYWTDEHERLSA